MTIISRLAPTPSGYLHLGNIFNFLLTWQFVRKNNGILYLRIDDFDHNRYKPEYAIDIFKSIDALGIDYDEGPQSIQELENRYSQSLKFEEYFFLLSKLKSKFICDCSRKDIKEKSSDGLYHGICIDRSLEFSPCNNLIRFNGDESLPIDVRYSILWSRDNRPSYHLVSVLEDSIMKTSHLIRGFDLKSSSEFQYVLADSLNVSYVKKENTFHHKLLSVSGEKLSKSQSSPAFKDMISNSSIENIYIEFSKFFNLKEELTSANDLISYPSIIEDL